MDADDDSDWHTTDIEVRICDTHDDPALVGQQGVIRQVSVSDSVLILDLLKILLDVNKYYWISIIYIHASL